MKWDTTQPSPTTFNFAPCVLLCAVLSTYPAVLSLALRINPVGECRVGTHCEMLLTEIKHLEVGIGVVGLILRPE